jgi:hypothetical protein
VITMTSPPNEECRPGEGGTPKIDPGEKISLGADNTEWLADYPEHIRALVRMDQRRRAASLRLPPLPSGKRDPWDLVRRDGSEAA